MSRIGIVGNDGRAYSLIKHIREHVPKVEITVVPGNQAIEKDFGCEYPNVAVEGKHLDIDDARIVDVLLADASIDFVIVTTIESALAGVVDILQNKVGMDVFGLGYVFSGFEANKHEGMNELRDMGVKVPVCALIKKDQLIWEDDQSIDRLLDDMRPDMRVVKRLGLVGGKGVTVCKTRDDVKATVKKILETDDAVQVQEFVRGTPVSFAWIYVDGYCYPICTHIDYKRTYTNDLGPMSGEVGCVAVAGIAEKAMDSIVRKVNNSLATRRRIRGVGRVGVDCIFTPDGEYVPIEWTCRLGSPTTETMLELFSDVNFYDWWHRLVRADVYRHVNDEVSMPLGSKRIAVGVVVSGGGYPHENACEQGLTIEVASDTNVIPMSVGAVGDKYVTKGGRQFVALGSGHSVDEARKKAYEQVEKVSFKEMIYRTDIGLGMEDLILRMGL